ncbi:MAG: CRISPR-associated protein Csm3 [Deferribacteres bacterium]|jgi:CRISPR-associated protein Csm3|nr:CRISPR-associated protein Csm3 family [Deferribacteraceae bacterium]MDK2792950.1 CRISPR-associated protein Csm3 [Deferribacteres bacterium]
MSALKIKNISGKIILESGLHIGGGDSEVHIGGVDNQVIKDPLTNSPYIPGSSLKGKIRSLLEYYVGAHLKTGGKPLQVNHLENPQEDEANIVMLFGTSGSEKNKDSFEPKYAISRVIFSDSHLNDSSKEILLKTIGKLTEVKAENSIDRITGTAKDPRFMERVPKGAEFDFSLSLKIFKGDDENSFLNTLLKGFKLLTLDALGGSGSRGYGRVSIKFDDNELQEKFNSVEL